MRRIYSTHDGAMIHYVQQVLNSEGIECILKNQYLAGGAGELPPIDCWPELWVLEDDNSEAALNIIHAILNEWPAHAATQPTHWQCPRCGTDNEPPFLTCWQCGYEHECND